MRNPLETRIALSGAKIEAIDDSSRDLLLRAREHVGEADRLESERYVEPLWAHFLSMEQVILLLACSQAALLSEIVKIDPHDTVE